MKYDESMVEYMRNTVAENNDEVDANVIETIMVEFDASERMISAKLRSLGYDVPRKTKGPSFTVEETAEFETLANENTTAEELAEILGKSVKQIRGKALSMKVKLGASPKKEPAPKKFTDAETAKIAKLQEKGKYLEEIADELGKSVKQIRGKLLSMKLKAPQRDKVKKVVEVIYTEDVIKDLIKAVNAGETASSFAEKTGLNIRGVKSRIGKLLKEGKLSAVPSDIGSKLKTVVDYTADLITQIKALSETHTSQEAAEELSIPVASLRAKSGRLGISFQKPEKKVSASTG